MDEQQSRLSDWIAGITLFLLILWYGAVVPGCAIGEPGAFEGPVGGAAVELNAREDTRVPASSTPTAAIEQTGGVNISTPDQSMTIRYTRDGWVTKVLAIAVVLAWFVPSPLKRVWGWLHKWLPTPE